MMNKSNFVFKLLLIAINLNFTVIFSQTTIISSTGDGGFETGTTMAANGWTVTGASPNTRWVCSTGATGYTGARGGYITNNASAPPSHAYTIATTAATHIYRNITIPAGQTSISLSFDWRGQGEFGFGTLYDGMKIWIVPAAYTPAYGTAITATGAAPTGRIQIGDVNGYSTQATWMNSNVTIPAAYAGTSVRLVFEWINDNVDGTQPPIAIDNISLVSQVPVVPSNNECTSAVALTVNSGLTCTTSTSGTTVLATQSQVGCAGAADDDVWYTFTASSSSHIISVTPSSLSDAVFQVFSGACGGLTSLACVNATSGASAETTTLAGLTIGSTYRLRVYSNANGSGQGAFSICVTTPIPNDDCAGAISLPVSGSCTLQTYSNVGATASSGAPAPGCGFYTGGDIWFSFVVPANGAVTIFTQAGVVTNGDMAIYSGTCAGLTLIECDETDGPGDMPMITRSGLTPGSTIYIRFWEFGNDTFGDFQICVSSPMCNSPAPLNLVPNLNSTTSATITWDATTPAPANGYDYYLSTSSTAPTIATTPTGSVGAGITSVSLTGLLTGTKYYVWVRSNCGGGNGYSNWSVVTYFNTPSCTTFGSGSGTSTFGCPNVVSGGQGLNGADPAPISCTAASTCVNLEATYLNIGNTTSYNVQSISYAPPYQFNCLRNPVSVADDDVWSPLVSLPFNFCFYGNTYNKCLIGSNGILSFDTTSNTAGGFSDWQFNANIPQAAHSALRINSIFGVFTDLNPRLGGEIGWELITLNTGCRALVVAWNDVPMFQCTTVLYSGMMVLYENTNVIEVYIKEKNVCASWNSGNAIVGIQNSTGTVATVATNRNGLSTDWTTTNEAWRFVPSGGSTPPTVAWYEGNTASGPVIGTSTILNVCPSATTTYTSEVTYTLCNGTTFKETDTVTVTISASKTWNGSVDTNWNVANNWTPSGVPTSADCIVIPDTANDPRVIGTNFNGLGLNLTIQNNASLTTTTNNDLTITDWVNVNIGGNLILENSASLIQVNNTTNTGTMNMTRTASVKQYDYVYWSSPVSTFHINSVSPSTIGFKYKWIPTIPSNTYGGVNGQWGNWSTANENMVVGKGYIVRTPNGYTSTPQNFNALFSGTPNNGTITTPILRGTYNGVNYNTGVLSTLATNNDDNWNLLGNPYPSAIRAINFLTLNTNIDGFIKIWTHGTLPSSATADPFYNNYSYNYTPGDYITYNSSGTSSGPGVFNGNIAAGQGFFVLMRHTSASNSENVTFNNSMRSSSHDNSQFFRSSNEQGRIWLDLVASDGTNVRNLVAYTDDATNDRDRLFDAITDEKLNFNLYSIIGEESMTIQGRALPFDQQDRVPMGIKVQQNGNYTIGIGVVDGFFTDNNQKIYLEDLENNIIHDLRLNPYVFSANAGNHPNRFVLRYTDETLGIGDNGISLDALNLIYNSNLVVSSSNTNIESVQIFDVLGRLLFEKKNVMDKELVISEYSRTNSPIVVFVKLINGSIIKKMGVF